MDKDDIISLNTSSNPTHSSNEQRISQDEEKHDEEINNLSELSLTEHDSFFTILKRLCFYWRRIVAHKIRILFALIFMSMLNITGRITCFTRQRTSQSSTSLTTAVSSSSIQSLEEDLNDSTKSPLLIDKTHQQQINWPSLHNSKMAHVLIQQQTHRTPNMNINRPTTSEKNASLLMRHSVDDRLFFHDSSQLINLLKRFASEPQISQNHIQSTNTNGQYNKTFRDFTLSLPISNPCVKLNEPEKDEIDFDDILIFNCDKIQPVSTSTTENLTSDKTDNISSSTTINHSLEHIITINDNLDNLQLNDDLKSSQINDNLISTQKIDGLINPQLHEDILLEINSSVNDNDTHGERHFRRRKRRSSLTRTSISLDDTQSTTDLLAKVDINNSSKQDNNENLKLKENEDKQNTNTTEIKIPESQESNQTTDDSETSAPVSRYRGRRLRHRFYRRGASSLQEVTSNISSDLYLSNKTFNIETPTIPPLDLSSSEIKSPHSLTKTFISNVSNGGLKRVNSIGSTKKNVRFADSIGRELEQVQYIQSAINDDSKELSFFLSSSFLSSSPPSFTKNNLYLPNTSFLEHKPWSFDVMFKSNKQINDKSYLKRFFCLYRQPNSEHPDIYLREIWKSQIKLEHADIPLKYSLTGEQQLIGTLWVTNIGFSKYVSIKYTFDNWLNTYEFEAQHCRHSNDFRNIDQFQFIVNIPKNIDRIDFILRYCVNGGEHWDNNEGKNYTLQTDSTYTTSTTISLPHDCDFNEMRFY
ncbi:unnamed protein product [Rotaria sordida]|uniref:CBM21 domain-containing protein n=1 Tax=Rotaria sordida TaxID=392033 RepID=A0A813ZLH9_9BILA|nr:unnamed protein product [Rotaria sordida]CAF0906692.1 unnamed protein product [Rotaria sordida]